MGGARLTEMEAATDEVGGLSPGAVGANGRLGITPTVQDQWGHITGDVGEITQVEHNTTVPISMKYIGMYTHTYSTHIHAYLYISENVHTCVYQWVHTYVCTYLLHIQNICKYIHTYIVSTHTEHM